MISSIHLVQPTATQGGSSSSQQGPAGNYSGSAGNGISTGGLNFSGFSFFNLPKFNFPFKLPSWFKWPFPSANLSAPIGHGSIGSGQGAGTGLGGGGGGGSGQGSQSGNGNTNTQSSSKDPPQFVIPTELLIIAVIIALIVAGLGFAVTQRKKLSRSPKQSAVVAPLAPIIENPPAGPESVFDPKSELIGEELVASFAGWGGNTGYIKPEISEDLPLIWSLDQPLKIEAPSGARLTLSGNELESPRSGSDPVELSVALGDPCNRVSGDYNGIKEEKWIRAVHYDEDVTKLFRLNLLNTSGLDLKSMTAREIANYMVDEHAEMIKDKKSLFGFTKIFERAFYGRKEINRKEYESFLRNLSGALNSPKVIVCGPRDQNPSK